MNILVTGASRGIGKELIYRFSEKGNHNLFLTARNEKSLQLIAAKSQKINLQTRLFPLGFDLSEIDKIKDLVSEMGKETDHIDIIVNNAGYLINKPFENTQPEEIERIYKTNVFAPFELVRCLLPLLKKSDNAHVINISSMGGYQGSIKFPGLAAYSSSKGAIAILTESLAEEFKDTQIKFNCLALGAVATKMLAEAFPGYEAPTTAEQMSEYIAEFALNGHKMFNGKIIPVSISTP